VTSPDGPVLVLNAGSSTLKAAVLAPPSGTDPADARLDLPAVATTTRRWADDHRVPLTLEHVLAEVGVDDPGSLAGIGHRIVHGGTDLFAPARIDADLVGALEALLPLAPLHLPPAIATIGAMRALAPDVVQVACFDTAFHAGLPEVDRTYAVPAGWRDALGLRRYGFHGLSVDWAVRRAAVLLDLPLGELGLVVAHLGAGASVTAVEGGHSIHTSMGYTPLEGLVMATRSGSLDPGIVTAMARAGHAPDDLEADLQQRSGLLALAGTGDMRELLALVADGDASARLALDVFVDRAAAAIGAAATRLARLDGVVLTGGIGEASPLVRSAIVGRLGVLGIAPLRAGAGGDTDRDAVLSAGDGPAVLRVAAREDRIIAAAVRELATT
jgi:acetate kinase